MKYRTRSAATENIQKTFINTPEDIISVEGIFKAWERNLEKVKDNKSWLSNKLTHWKYHNLVKPIYSFKTGHRVLEKIQLTLEGKKAIGRVGEDVVTANTSNGIKKITFEDIMKEIPRIRKENPDFNITLSVTPRD